jgi:hypothetical protein
MDNKSIIAKLKPELKTKIIEKAKYNLSDESKLLEIASLLLPFVNDEIFNNSFDYLRCKTEHQKQIANIQRNSERYYEFEDMFHELRHELRKAGHTLAESIRYGKRNENIDELLTKIVMLEKIASSAKPNINISTESPTRCNQCNKECLGSYRIMLTQITSLLENLENENN